MSVRSKLLQSGEKFNNLTVIKLDHIEQQVNFTDKGIRNIEYYLCQCVCGEFKIVEKMALKKGHVRSCGCKTYNLVENNFVIKDDYAELHIGTKREEKPVIILIDKEDIERINFVKWSLKYDKTLDNYYVYAWERNNYKNRKRIILHRFLTNCPDNLQVDHINRDTLDNRKNNLRIVSQQENANNKGEYKNNKSGYKNIYHIKKLDTWVCEIKRNKKVIFRFQNKDLNMVINAKQRFLKESEVENGI